MAKIPKPYMNAIRFTKKDYEILKSISPSITDAVTILIRDYEKRLQEGKNNENRPQSRSI